MRTRQKVKQKINLLRCLSGTSWGCDLKTGNTFRRAIVETTASYGSSAYGLFGAKTYISHIEAARNEAARVVSGCPRSTKTDELRRLLAMKSIQKIGLDNAAREAEKALRQDATPLQVQLEKKLERKTKRRSSTRDSVMEHSANVGNSGMEAL